MAMRFEGRVVIVTGAGSGIGAAAARRFLGEGANVVLVSRNDTELKQAAVSFDKNHYLIQKAEVSDEKQSKNERRWAGRQSGAWRLIHRHADPLVDAQSKH